MICLGFQICRRRWRGFNHRRPSVRQSSLFLPLGGLVDRTLIARAWQPSDRMSKSGWVPTEGADCDMTRMKAIRGAFGAASLVAASSFALPVEARPISIVAFGDSLTAGYRLDRNEAFPARLQQALKNRGYDVTVLNAGISGDTSGGGLARVSRDVPKSTDLVILELGANDILRGVPPVTTERNLDAILDRLKRNGSDVVLAGMIAPPGLGNAFSRSFNPIFERLAAKHGAALYPFFLKGVAMRSGYNLGDGIHPNAAGVDRIVDGILPVVTARLDAMS